MISIVIPAKNEAANLALLLPDLLQQVPGCEILVIDDGSTDETPSLCNKLAIRCISHPRSKGNGAAIKTGARHAKGEIIIFMDGDGQHDPKYIHDLLRLLDDGHDMAVGARSSATQADSLRRLANGFYNKLASWMVGQTIPDLTSGFRAVKAEKFREFLFLLPNTFSYPTTITMAFFRSGYSIAFSPIDARKRLGKSHISLAKDGLRFLLIIFKIGTLFSPLKLFFPISVVYFMLGCFWFSYTYITENRFTNMGALLFINAMLVFLIGLVSEQITNLLYKPRN